MTFVVLKNSNDTKGRLQSAKSVDCVFFSQSRKDRKGILFILFVDTYVLCTFDNDNDFDSRHVSAWQNELYSHGFGVHVVLLYGDFSGGILSETGSLTNVVPCDIL